jgi:hypothetical protein
MNWNNRFWPKVAIIPEHPCWEWIGKKNDTGYGSLAIRQGGNKRKWYKAHRISWELHYGQIPKGLHCLHKCDNPGCVRPDHLFLGTQLDNVRDMDKKQRRISSPQAGQKNGKSKLTEKKVIAIRKEYKKGKISQLFLANKYGVCQSTIDLIVRKITWKHI